MKKKCLLFHTLFISAISVAQTDTTYLNTDLEKCVKTKATYYRIVSKQGDDFLVKDMYIKNNLPQMVAWCNAIEPLSRNGTCMYYFSNGQKESTGNYINDKKSGEWVQWIAGGKDSAVYNYKEDGSMEVIRTPQVKTVIPDKDAPLTIVEQMPMFKGGEQAMMYFIQKNIKYPRKAKRAGITGTCYITFVVEKDGTISNVKVLRGVTGGQILDEAAMKVVKKMPQWTPGKQSGKEVRVQFNLPIKFTLK